MDLEGTSHFCSNYLSTISHSRTHLRSSTSNCFNLEFPCSLSLRAESTEYIWAEDLRESQGAENLFDEFTISRLLNLNLSLFSSGHLKWQTAFFLINTMTAMTFLKTYTQILLRNWIFFSCLVRLANSCATYVLEVIFGIRCHTSKLLALHIRQCIHLVMSG